MITYATIRDEELVTKGETSVGEIIFAGRYVKIMRDGVLINASIRSCPLPTTERVYEMHSERARKEAILRQKTLSISVPRPNG